MARNSFLGINNNSDRDDIIIRIGEVVSVDDEYKGCRIKVRLDQDRNTKSEDLPYSFPLLPKTLQTIPKIGEAVLIILSRMCNKNSIRYYIGPLISQPQHFYKENYINGFGSSTSLIVSSKKPLETIDHYNETNGSFPNVNDIALIGRKSEDVILKDGEVDIRCGIRQEKVFDDIDFSSSLKGDVIFNKQNPAYLQLKYKRGLCKGNKQVADSVVNIVADKINLISHKDEEHFNLTDQNELIQEKELDNIMSKLHQVPYGDLLVNALKLFLNALVKHVHPYPGLPPVPCENIIGALGVNLDEILSENVRIS